MGAGGGADRRAERGADADRAGAVGRRRGPHSAAPGAAPRAAALPEDVGTVALGWPLSAGAEGTGPPKGSVWSVSEETRQPRPGHGVSYDGIKSPVFFLSVLNVRTHKHLVFKLSSYFKSGEN